MNGKNVKFAARSVLLLLLVGAASAQPSDTERIRELEARVTQLEAALRTLLSAQKGAEAEPLPPVAESAVPPAPVEQQRQQQSRQLPQELLPNLGKIGASVRLVTGTGAAPGAFWRDSFFGGSAQLPLLSLPGGKLSYDLSAGILNYDRNQGRDSARLLEIVPFGLVYAPTVLDRYRIRPHLAVGLGNYVLLSARPVAGAGLNVGVRTGGGIEWRFSRDAGIGWDFRYNRVNSRFQYLSSGPSLFWHF